MSPVRSVSVVADKPFLWPRKALNLVIAEIQACLNLSAADGSREGFYLITTSSKLN